MLSSSSSPPPVSITLLLINAVKHIQSLPPSLLFFETTCVHEYITPNKVMLNSAMCVRARVCICTSARTLVNSLQTALPAYTLAFNELSPLSGKQAGVGSTVPITDEKGRGGGANACFFKVLGNDSQNKCLHEVFIVHCLDFCL